MKIDPDLLRQLLPTFKAELEDRSQAIVDGLLALESTTRAAARKPILDTIFRAAHNIKGAARGVELNQLSDIAHALEDLFSRLRQGEIKPLPELISQCLQAVDRLRDAAGDVLAERPIGFDVPALVNRLGSAGAEAVNSVVDAGKRPPRKKRAGKRAAVKKTAALSPKPKASAPRAKPEETIDATSQSRLDPAPALARLAPKSHPPATQPTAPGTGDQPASSKHPSAEILHVGVDKLQAIGAIGEELQLTRLQIEDHHTAIQRLHHAADRMTHDWQAAIIQLDHLLPKATGQHAVLRQNLKTCRRLATDLRFMERDVRASATQFGLQQSALIDRIRMLRLVPAATLLRPMARVVRDISRDLDKTVLFSVSGDQVELDRSVLDAIRDPLIHLLRNAIDHGIGGAAARKAADKPAEGHLDIKVSRQGSEILITVADDGAGIDVENLRRAALRKGLFNEAELDDMSPAEILELVFQPGFSSKQEVSTVSGRGVGLDVVRVNLRQLKGDVSIHTRVGQGTQFQLRVPLTLATDQGLFVRCGKQQYALPTTSVDRVLTTRTADIVSVEGSQAILINRRAVPLRSLQKILGADAEPSATGNSINVVVVARGLDRVGFVVDEIVGEREIVIRPLQTLLQKVRFVAGATMTGSGAIVVVLNPDDLLAGALQQSMKGDAVDHQALQEKIATRILVVDDSITTRTLVKGILQSRGFDVYSAVNGREGLAQLQSQPVDLVVTDIEMPEMNGFELTAAIRADERLARLPVIMVTSLARDEDRQRGMEVGADAYIVKGVFETQSLLDVIRQLVDS